MAGPSRGNGLPGGELVYLVAVLYWSNSTYDKDYSEWYPYVVQQFDDGELHIIMAPPPPPLPGPSWIWGDAHAAYWSPIFYCEQLIYNPTFDAILAWPAVGHDYASAPVYFDMVAYAGGPGGYGFYVIPIEGVQTAYQSMLHGRADGLSRSPSPSSEAMTMADGTIVFPVYPLDDGLLRKVTFNLDRVDMDTDGLSYNEEKALGTTDYSISSDGGTTADSVEATITGTDPAVMDDEPAPFRPGIISYMESGLIRKHFSDLGIVEEVQKGITNNTSAHGPLCLKPTNDGMECIFKDGRSRTVIPTPYGSPIRFSHDGTFAIYETDNGLEQYFFEEGMRHLFVPMNLLMEPTANLATEDVTWYAMDFLPADKDLVYVTYHQTIQNQKAWDEFYIYAFHRDEPGQLVYDHQQARCDSGLGECDPSLEYWQEQTTLGNTFLPHDILFRGITVFGYIPEIDRLVINVAGVWGRYYVGLHPDHEPEVLVGPNYLKGGPDTYGMPTFVQPTGHDDYLVTWGIMDGWLNMRSWVWFQGMGSNAGTAMFWDDIAVNSQTDGLWEGVRYEGWGEPGDVLLMDHSSNDLGYIVMRSGPRGGFAYAWAEPAPLDEPYGLDVSHDGKYLCVAKRAGDYDHGGVDIFAAHAPGAVPSSLVMSVGDIGDITDCHWGGDGSLYWLKTNPPSVERLPELWVEEYEVVEEWPDSVMPLELIVAPDGSFEVLDDNGPYRGLTYLSDGRRLEVPTGDFWVWIEGEKIVNLNTIVWGVYGTPAGNNAPALIHFQERSDGLVVAVPFERTPWGGGTGGTALIFDPDTGELWPLSSMQLNPGLGNGLAIMPGGDGRYPWPAVGDAALDSGPEGPADVDAPGPGYDVTRTVKGCSTHPATDSGSCFPAVLLLSLLVFVHLRRVRRGVLAAILAIAFIAPGCGGSGLDEDGPGGGGGGGGGGSGGSNVESLMPLTVGARFVVLDGATLMHRVIAEETTVNGSEGRKVQWSDGTVNTWQKASQGWALAATNTGEFDPPLLMVPHRVYVGMSWEAGEQRYNVVAHRYERTPWGKRHTWRILRNGGNLGTKVRVYVEGRGWWKDEGANFKEVMASFIPLVPEDRPEVKLDKVKLEPFLGIDGEQLVLGLEGEPLYALEDEPGSIVLAVQGQSWAFLNSSWVLITHSQCLRLEAEGVQDLSFTEDGSSYLKGNNAVCHSPIHLSGEVGDPAPTHYHIPPWIAPDGETYFYIEPGHINKTDVVALVAAEGETQPTVLNYYGGHAKMSPWGNESFDLQESLRLHGDPLAALMHFDDRIERRLSPRVITGGNHMLGTLTHSGVLLESRLSLEDGVSRPKPLVHAGFQPIVTTLAGGDRMLFAGPGFVDELTLDDEGATIERVARFSIPQNHFPTGAVRLDNEIIFTTGNRIDGADPFNNKDARRTYFWRLAALYHTGVPIEPPPSLAVSAMISGVDIVVCWPETDESQALETDGWTIGGAPALQVLQLFGNGNCALIVRDFDQASDLWVDGGNLVTGTVPGVGPMEITVPAGVDILAVNTFYTDGVSAPGLWPTPDGGFIGAGKVFDEVGLPQFAGPPDLGRTKGIQDPMGNGFWKIEEGHVVLHTSEGETISSVTQWLKTNGLPEQIEWLGRVAGGGVMVRIPLGGSWFNFRIALDGTVSEVPTVAAGDYKGYEAAAYSIDETFCAVRGIDELYCGKEEPVKFDEPIAQMGGAALYPLASNHILAIVDATGWLIDPVAMTATAYEDGQSFKGHYTYDLEGTLYFLPMVYNGSNIGWDTPDSNTLPFEVTADGLVPLVLPSTGNHADFQANLAALVPTFDHFFFYLANGSFVRWPR